MKRPHYSLLVILAIISMLGTFGCGNSASNPTIPSTDGLTDADTGSETGGTGILGVYELMFDPETMALELVEVRGAADHYVITAYAAHHCGVSGVTWDPLTRILEFDLALTNASIVTIFDLRTLLLTDPASGFELLNQDDYTQLFNPFGPDDVNAFIAYAKYVPGCEFGDGATHSEHFIVQYPPVISLPAKLLVECSWPGNCEDPFEISNQTLSNPISTTTNGTITLDAYDHQNNIGAIYVDTTPITGGLTWLTNTGGTTWEGGLHNSMGAAPAIYTCRITADSWASPDNLYDFIAVEVVPVTSPGVWSSVDYPIGAGGCSMDLGVIADPGGPRDSEILMIEDGVKPCDTIIKYDPYYAAHSHYVGLYDYDSNNNLYQPYPVLRLDAADDGAFSFTNDNHTLPFPSAGSGVYNYQVWSVFDNSPMLHTGPAPDEGRYYFDLSHFDALCWPVDVCDDFGRGQYTLFTTEVTYSPEDLIFLGTMPKDYTYDNVRYRANLDPWAGIGYALVDPARISGIDVIEDVDPYSGVAYAMLYILEGSPGTYQVEVFKVSDTAPGWGDDSVSHMMTINVDYFTNSDHPVLGRDIEILPISADYRLNTTDPTLCVLVSYHSLGTDHGEVLLYNASTGAFLESIGDLVNPSLPDSEVHYLDTDDGDWEIHVTRVDAAGNTLATVFSYI